ncbi:hypothetical protein [Streptomyces sp. t39]|uniref:hypothetical protein n=1 Tax=Streptomyces sp. t39 TaxID=1828156 RepID=UPI0011CDAEE4|nr:hypothetical protein [Streptomyces sp. t39]TXS55713.1 hypothetical protein EAO77_05735 [Streptomyces sp. t39]
MSTDRVGGDSLRREGSIGLIAADARIPALSEALAVAGMAYLSPGEETTAESRLTLVPATPRTSRPRPGPP